jgi:hypothetical protein
MGDEVAHGMSSPLMLAQMWPQLLNTFVLSPYMLHLMTSCPRIPSASVLYGVKHSSYSSLRVSLILPPPPRGGFGPRASRAMALGVAQIFPTVESLAQQPNTERRAQDSWAFFVPVQP